MARKRMIDPTIWQDEDFGKLSFGSKILFIGLLSNADDDGYIRANPLFLRSTIFMYDSITPEEVETDRTALTDLMKSVHYFQTNGNQYIHFIKWEIYQSQKNDRRKPSTFPKCTICFPIVGQSGDIVETNDVQAAPQVKLSKISKVKLSKLSETSPKKYSSIKDISEEDIYEISEQYKVTVGFVNYSYERLKNYCSSHNKKYSNYKSALKQFVLSEAAKLSEKSKGDPTKRGIDATDL